MPASSYNSYLQDARNNFDAMRPAPICTDANQTKGHYQNVHISTNCYYGYQDLKPSEKNHVDTDCEMLETEVPMVDEVFSHPTSRKRNADNRDYPQSKRLRTEVQKEKSIEPETNEKTNLDTSTEDYMESLYWHIHGGNMFHAIQCL